MMMRLGMTTAAFLVAGSALAAPMITDAQVRAPMGGQDMTAAYLMITNPDNKSDALIGVTSTIAHTAELHDVKTTNGIKRMFEIKKVPIPAGKMAHFMPGGQHIMLFDLKTPLKIGDTVPLILTFKRAGAIPVAAKVVARPAVAAHHAH